MRGVALAGVGFASRLIFPFCVSACALVVSSLSRLQHSVSLRILVNFEFISDTRNSHIQFPRIFKKRLAYYGIAQELFNLVLGLAYLWIPTYCKLFSSVRSYANLLRICLFTEAQPIAFAMALCLANITRYVRRRKRMWKLSSLGRRRSWFFPREFWVVEAKNIKEIGVFSLR